MATVFLDIDGVISDIDQLGADFDSLIGDVLAPALGGSPRDWGRANHASFPRVIDYLRQGRLEDDPIARFNQESHHLIEAMCELLDVPAPDAETAARLGRQFNEHVRRNGSAPDGEARPVIEALAASRDVHLATGNLSWNAIAVLENIGVTESVDIPAGADLVGAVKELPVFYERLFALATVRASDAIVVDDSPVLLAHAASLGARTVLVSAARHRPSDLPASALVVDDITGVPDAVVAIEAAAVPS